MDAIAINGDISSVAINGNVVYTKGGGGSTPSAPSGNVPPINSPASPQFDLGLGGGTIYDAQVSPNIPIGMSLTVSEASTSRGLRWSGRPGAFFQYLSWAIFDLAGNRVMGQDNVIVMGTAGFSIDYATYLSKLAPGTYNASVAVNNGGNLGSNWQQYPT